VFVVRIINARKGLAPGTLYIIVIAVIIGIIILVIMESQTGFITNAAKYLANLLSFKLP